MDKVKELEKPVLLLMQFVMYSFSLDLIDWMVFYAAFNSISVISRRQFKLFMSYLGFTSTRLGL